MDILQELLIKLKSLLQMNNSQNGDKIVEIDAEDSLKMDIYSAHLDEVSKLKSLLDLKIKILEGKKSELDLFFSNKYNLPEKSKAKEGCIGYNINVGEKEILYLMGQE